MNSKRRDFWIHFGLGAVAGIPYGFFLWIGLVDPREEKAIECLLTILNCLGHNITDFDSYPAGIMIVTYVSLLSGFILARSGSWNTLVRFAMCFSAGILGWMIGSHGGVIGAVLLFTVGALGTELYFRKST